MHTEEVVVGGGQARTRHILVYNSKEAERERAQRESIAKELEEKPKFPKQLPNQQHMKAICELRSHPVYGR